MNPPLSSNMKNSICQTLKFISALVLLSGLLACAAASTTKSNPNAQQPAIDVGLAGANNMYNTRNYLGAVREFDVIISDPESSANSQRLANLGKALIYLGDDENWHSLENAKMSLMAAGGVVPANNEEFAVETDLLMDAIASLTGAESKYEALETKAGGSSGEIAGLKKERDALAIERDALLMEQAALNEALERLKKLTLGD